MKSLSIENEAGFAIAILFTVVNTIASMNSR